LGKEILILRLEFGIWPNFPTSELHPSKMTKVMSPLVRCLSEMAPGRAEIKEQDTTKGFAARGPGQLCSFECLREHGMDKMLFPKITQK